MNWTPIAQRTRAVSDEVRKSELQPASGPHVSVGFISYPPPKGRKERQTGVIMYIKASLSGDENDYVLAYKAAHPTFPHESTADQMFSEEQFEAYRALGEHIARRALDGRDAVAAFPADRSELLQTLRELLPGTNFTSRI
jgi:hypothetical protein